MVGIIGKAQQIGSKKYYGNDYMILNTVEVLRNIFNDDNANLYYDGAENDLVSINNIVPIVILKEQGQYGFRNYNWTSGRKDYNQTLATDIQSNEYIKAYYRIVLHNIDDYLNVQLNCLYRCLSLDTTWPEYSYEGAQTVELKQFQYTQWMVGRDELYSEGKTYKLAGSGKRQFVYIIMNKIHSTWTDIMSSSGINIIIYICFL